MELGSAEHKALLWKTIRSTAFKTLRLGGLVSAILIIPSLIYSNAFSSGLAYAGMVTLGLTLGYTGATVWQKYQKIIKPLSQKS